MKVKPKKLVPTNSASQLLADKCVRRRDGAPLTHKHINSVISVSVDEPKNKDLLERGPEKVRKNRNARYFTPLVNYVRKYLKPKKGYRMSDIINGLKELAYVPDYNSSTYDQPSDQPSLAVQGDLFIFSESVPETPDYSDLVRREAQYFEAILLDVLPVVQDAIAGVDKKYRELPVKARGLYLNKCHVARNRFVRKVLKPLMDG